MELAIGLILLVVFLSAPIFWVLTILYFRRLKKLRLIAEARITNIQSEAKGEISKANYSAQKTKDFYEDKYKEIIDIDHEVSNRKDVLAKIHLDIRDLRETYHEKRSTFDTLRAQVVIYDERLALAELGVYERHFDFNDSQAFKDRILEVRAEQKAMVSSKAATECSTDWQVDGSRSKGQTMINRQTKLTMRAFNNECEAAIANARWNNVNAMEKRILASFKAVNDQNSSMSLSITGNYLKLKLQELFLTHEYREQLKFEKDERAELARAEREEKKLVAQADAAEKEEEKYQKLLEKARQEAGISSSSALTARIEELESAISDAHEKGERARAMAELTQSGYVYVISNVGSFGEDVVKIGLTRRVDPDDRVRELGDASVPFRFDTHAMIYSDAAPALETALHKEFADRRINMSNMRKEFFRVDIDEVEEAVKRLAPNASFLKDREAQEWHETLSRRQELLATLQSNDAEMVPSSI